MLDIVKWANPTARELTIYVDPLIAVELAKFRYVDISLCRDKDRDLLQDDNEWYTTFNEATIWATTPQLCNLFATLLTYCNLQDEQKFFIEQLLAKKGVNTEKHNILQITMTPKITTNNHFIEEELNYNTMTLEYEANISYNQLNIDQNEAFHKVIESVLRQEPKIFFIYGHGIFI
jgi:hypothetical protein